MRWLRGWVNILLQVSNNAKVDERFFSEAKYSKGLLRRLCMENSLYMNILVSSSYLSRKRRTSSFTVSSIADKDYMKSCRVDVEYQMEIFSHIEERNYYDNIWWIILHPFLIWLVNTFSISSWLYDLFHPFDDAKRGRSFSVQNICFVSIFRQEMLKKKEKA